MINSGLFFRLPSQIIQEPPKEVEGPFKLDPGFMKDLDTMKLTLNMPKIQQIDLGFLYEHIKIPTREEAKARYIILVSVFVMVMRDIHMIADRFYRIKLNS